MLEGLLMDRLNWNLNLPMTDEPNAENAEDEQYPEFAATATFTHPDGTTVTTTDFSINDLNLELDADGMDEVSSGLSEAVDDAKQEFQLSLEVPTKTLVCPNCDHANKVPVWSFVDVSFSGDLEPLSGEYAIGHQCVNCGFPY